MRILPGAKRRGFLPTFSSEKLTLREVKRESAKHKGGIDGSKWDRVEMEKYFLLFFRRRKGKVGRNETMLE